MRESIWEGGAVYILIGETFDILAEASGDELCTHKVIMRPPPTNQQAAAHNRHLDLQRCRHPSLRTHGPNLSNNGCLTLHFPARCYAYL